MDLVDLNLTMLYCLEFITVEILMDLVDLNNIINNRTVRRFTVEILMDLVDLNKPLCF